MEANASSIYLTSPVPSTLERANTSAYHTNVNDIEPNMHSTTLLASLLLLAFQRRPSSALVLVYSSLRSLRISLSLKIKTKCYYPRCHIYYCFQLSFISWLISTRKQHLTTRMIRSQMSALTNVSVSKLSFTSFSVTTRTDPQC